MVMYKVLQQFKDKHTKEMYTPGDVIEMTVKRAAEAERNLKKHAEQRKKEYAPFLERVEEKDED